MKAELKVTESPGKWKMFYNYAPTKYWLIPTSGKEGLRAISRLLTSCQNEQYSAISKKYDSFKAAKQAFIAFLRFELLCNCFECLR